jgi:hypothetical protein
MWQNTNLSLQQIVNDLQDTLDEGIPLSAYVEERGTVDERYAIKGVRRKCQELLDILGTMEAIEKEMHGDYGDEG